MTWKPSQLVQQRFITIVVIQCNVLHLSAGSITYDATLTQLHADKHMVPVKMSNTGQVGENEFIILVQCTRFHEWVLKIQLSKQIESKKSGSGSRNISSNIRFTLSKIKPMIYIVFIQIASMFTFRPCY